MSSSPSSSRFKRTCQFVLPALGLAWTYWVVWGGSLVSRIHELQTHLSKTPPQGAQIAQIAQGGQGSQGGLERTAEQLRAAERLTQSLKEELAQLQVLNQRLASQPAADSRSAVSRMAALMALLGRCGLQCTESAPAEADQHDATSEATGEATGVRIRVTGNFEQMRQALREMQASPTCVSVLSLAMEPSVSLEDASHQWILIILV